MSDQTEALRQRLDALTGTSEDQLENALYDLTESIDARMKELGINRSQLADRLGVSRAMVTKMLRGNTNFTVRSLVELSRALECRVSIQMPPCGFRSVPFFVAAERAERRSYRVPLAHVPAQSVPYRSAREVQVA